MNKKFSSFLLAGTISASLGISSLGEVQAASNSQNKASVNTSSLTVRSGAGINFKAIDYLQKGQSVTVIKDLGAFSRISYENGKKGYVGDKYLTKKSSTVSKVSNKKTTYKVNVGMLNLRSQPSASSKIKKVLYKNTKVTLVSSSGNWYKVKYGTTTGYVNKKYVTKTSSSNTTTTTNTNTSTVSTRMYVNASSLNLRSSGSASAKVLKSLPRNTAVSVLNKKGTWWKVKAGSVIGYVNSSYLSKSTSSISTQGNTSKPSAVSSSLKGKLIVIDPGHGGKFAGSQGIVHEEDTNLAIALKTRTELQKQGATVIMTRTKDVHLSSSYNADLFARSNIANNSRADMFISIHANAGGGTGTEVFYSSVSRGDKKLATNIVNQISSNTGLKNRGAKDLSYAVIRNTNSNITSVLVETAFTDTRFDANILGTSSGQSKMASSIAKGVLNYYGK